MSMLEIHSPPDLITSLDRSVICMNPSGSMVATSPVSKKPCSSRIFVSSLKYLSTTANPRTLSRPKRLPSHGSSLFSSSTIFISTPNGAQPCLDWIASLCSLRKAARAGLERAGRADRAHLRHAPGVANGDAVILLEGADHVGRTGRAANADEFERRELLVLLAQVLQQAEPNGRHGRRHRHLLGLEEIVDGGAVEPWPRHHHARAAHRAGEREAPRIGVEHRHHRQNRIVGGRR